VMSIVKAINAARKSVEIVIFRFDRREIERALASAVKRGATVRALIAHTNRAGEDSLRQLEMRLLEAGVMVARTADDLVRYHSKFMIIDHRELYVLAFNLTYADIERSRSFGIMTRNIALVREALKLFDADVQRRSYEAGLNRFVVSPSNARLQLANFIVGAKKELAIYDPKVSDPAMTGLLEARARAGVTIRIIGRLARAVPGVETRRLSGMKLHTRTMIRDRSMTFVGSQSLREPELDSRREVGMILRDAAVANSLMRTFQEDWAAGEPCRSGEEPMPAEKVARKVAKAVTKDLPSLVPVLNGAVKEVAGEDTAAELNAEEVEEIVKDAIKEAVKEAVMEAVEEAVEQEGKAS